MDSGGAGNPTTPLAARLDAYVGTSDVSDGSLLTVVDSSGPGGVVGGVSVGAAVLVAGDWKVRTRTYTGVLARSGIGVLAG